MITTDLAEIRDKILPVLQRHAVLRAAIFGSVARREARPGSDLDLLVELPPGKSLLDLAAIQLDLEDLLGGKVEILTYPELHPRIRERVLRDQVRIL